MIDRRYLVRYIAPTGKTWELSSGTWIAGIRRAGIKELIGRPEATGIETLGVPGRAIEGLRFPAIEGSLDLFVRAGQGRHAHDIWAEFRHGFSILPPLGTLQIESPMGTMHAQVRLNGAPSDLEVDDATADVWALSIPLAIDAGYWETTPFRKTGSVTVTNSGQVYIWPEIVWEGAGGKVTLPSSAEFTLPAVDSTRRLRLDPQRSHQVLTAIGVRDDDLWRRIRGQIISEGVPPGQSRQYDLPAGAFLEWRIGVLDPWR